MSNLIGKTIDQYQVVEQIGMGGMATVYKAYQLSMDRYVAIKVLPSQFAEDPNFVKRFAQEAKAIAALEHPHILPVHDFGTEDNLNYMVMRYVEGGTLANLMGKSMPYEQIVRVVGNVARALNYAHRKGVIHRDIKPSNILIDPQGEVLLTDFGIAKIVEGSKATQLTADGSILGTPAYMAPEQAQGSHIDGRTDIYSLGVVLYELLTGRPPYQAETPFAVALKHITEPLPLPRTVKPDIPEPFERVVLKAMAKDPNLRYQTALEMAQALESAQREVEALATVPIPRPSPQPAAREVAPKPAGGGSMKPILIGGGVVVALLCLLAIGGFAILAFIGSDIEDRADRRPTNTPRASVNIGNTATPSATPTLPSTPTEAAPTEEPTSEPEATPTEMSTEPTAEPSAEIDDIDEVDFFEDDFSTNETGWFLGRDTDDFSEFKAFFADGRYRTEMTAVSEDGAFTWLEPIETEFDDFTYSVEAMDIEASGEYSYGMIFRSDLEGNFYIFEIDDQGFVVILAQSEADWETLIEYTESDAIDPEGWNELKVEAVGASYTFYINGEEVATLEDDQLEDGTIGLALDITNQEDNLIVEFDNVLVTEP